MLQIETPGYFKPERFNSFAAWVAVTLEENLWANFNYFKAKSKPKNQAQGRANS